MLQSTNDPPKSYFSKIKALLQLVDLGLEPDDLVLVGVGQYQ